jgi:hypothetical protein
MLDAVTERLQVAKLTLGFDLDAFTGVDDEAGQTARPSQIINEGPESDPLDNTRD